MFRRRLLVFTLVFAFIGGLISAAQSAEKITVRADKDTAIYAKNEKIAFNIMLLDGTNPIADKELNYTILGDGSFKQTGTITSGKKPVAIETSLPHPGLLRCSVSFGKVSAIGGAAVAPLEIKSNIAEPADFDEFWNNKKAELAKVPLNPKLTPVPKEKYKVDNVEVFDVKIDCLGGKPVSGYFAKPANAKPKSLPILVSYHGAGVRSSNIPAWNASRGVLALDINAHGIENGLPEQFYKDLAEGDLKDYRTRDGNDREKVYFLGMFLRVFRSLQFMKSLPEWDGKIVAVTGGSQGGGQALTAAGGDHDVTFCVAHVPAICYPLGSLEGNFDGWPGFLRGKTKEDADPAVVKSVPYIDAANFAKRIKAEAVLSTGFIDTTCSATSVYIAYNNIKPKKVIFTTPEATHAVPKETGDKSNKLLWDYIEANRVK
ncbi:cephalosporin deacetylase [Planctomycetales bacterium]|nr:cephalosporin deacetylase [Planctomycetales bacterium]GHT38829.1 cephalosporin deacetylase [Planctomycetales bacterium]